MRRQGERTRRHTRRWCSRADGRSQRGRGVSSEDARRAIMIILRTDPFTVYKLARILWAMIVSGQPYDEKKAFAITEASTARRLKNLQHQAKALNMTLVPAQ